MEIKIYKTSSEVRGLTSRLAEKLGNEEGIAIDSINLVSRLPNSIIDPNYMVIREAHVRDSGKYHLSGLITSTSIYFTLYEPTRESPVVVELAGNEVLDILKQLNIEISK